MKAASLKQIKNELKHLDREQLIEHILKVSKYKVENKELLTYLLFESQDEDEYIRTCNEEVSLMFSEVNRDSYYFMKKNIRKILRIVKKHVRYSKIKTTEAELLLHFCNELKAIRPRYSGNSVLVNMMEQQKKMILKACDKIHPDLQYDYLREFEDL